MSLKRKRTVAEEKRIFNSKWELDYFMIDAEAHTMMCLICSQVVKTVNGDNAKQHFRRHVSHTYAKLEGESRKICIENLKKSLRQQTSCMSSTRLAQNYEKNFFFLRSFRPFAIMFVLVIEAPIPNSTKVF